MPEGDTLHRLARALAPRLVEREITWLSTRERGRVSDLTGATTIDLNAVGKNLMLAFSTGYGLRLHLGMKGELRRHGPGMAARYPYAALVIATRDDTFVCSRARRVEFFRGSAHPVAGLLGPDLAVADADLDAVMVRARAPERRGQPLGELLLDQGVAAGIGNVFKSEVLFIQRLDPFAPTHAVGDSTLREAFAEANAQLVRSVEQGRRVTVSMPQLRTAGVHQSPKLWVYRRQHAPCLRCGTAIAMRRQGDLARSTYFCPACQRT